MPCGVVPMARAAHAPVVDAHSPPNGPRADSAPTVAGVSKAKTAASAGTPPVRSAMPTATGAVTDFGTRDRSSSLDSARPQPSPVQPSSQRHDAGSGNGAAQ